MAVTDTSYLIQWLLFSYDVDSHVIRPMTKQKKWSLVEMMATDTQMPDWFVSHYWGEEVPILCCVVCS